MTKYKINRRLYIGLAFILAFGLGLAASVLLVGATPVQAQDATPSPETVQPSPEAAQTSGAYAGSQACAQCHPDLHTEWMTTRHAQAFSSPIFQEDWVQRSSDATCLQCHTTGFDLKTGEYAEEGVTCESCHGAFQPTHPKTPMPLTPNAELCGQCHKNTTSEWKASPHNAAGIQCQACHNPHAQTPMADSITALCTNCHKERGDSFTHGTHANAGLECSNCHMYTSPRTDDPIGGLVATGHTFSVGSDACIGCHQDTVHTRDELMRLSGQEFAPTPDVSQLQEQIHTRDQEISNLQTSGNVRLYTGLIQGAIIGLITGGVAAWIVSRRIREVEVEE